MDDLSAFADESAEQNCDAPVMKNPRFQMQKVAGAALDTQKPETRTRARELRRDASAAMPVGIFDVVKWVGAAMLIAGVLFDAFTAP